MGKRTFLLLVAPWWAFILFAYAHLPPSPDDGDIDYMGWMLLRGGVQYVDFIDMNWPGGVWLHAFSTWLFGNNLMSWRILDFGIAMVAMVALVDLVARAYGRAAALWLAALYPVLYATLGLWMAGQRDAVVGHGLIIALACHARAWERQQLRWQAMAGVVLGLSILVKPTIGFAGPLLVLHGMVWSLRGAGISRALLHGAVAGGCALMVMLAGLGVQLLLGAPLESVIDGAYLLNRLGHQVMTVDERTVFAGIWNVFRVLLHWVSALAVAGFFAVLLDRGRSLANRLLLLIPIAAGLVNYLVQRKYFEYHLMVAVPGVLALACVALGEASRRWRSGPLPIRIGAALAMLLAISGSSVKLWKLSDPVVEYRLGLMDRTEYYARFRPFQIDYGQLLLLSERIEREVPEGGTVLVWGSQNAINYLSGRPQPTRFHHWVALSYAKPPLPMAEKWNRWFAEDLTKHSPEMVVIDEVIMKLSAERAAPNHFFLEQFLAERYEKVQTIDEVALYVRKDRVAPREPPVENTVQRDG
jgi:hypothetical protein